MRVATTIFLLAAITAVFSSSIAERQDDVDASSTDAAASIDAAAAKTGSAQYTDFDGVTACGTRVRAGELAVGIGSGFKDSLCGRAITITAPNGKNAQGTLQDKCGDGCGRNGIIVSKALFKKFYPLEKGVFQATWQFA